jgi:hypothetical protein
LLRVIRNRVTNAYHQSAFLLMLGEALHSSDPRVHRLALQVVRLRMRQRFDLLVEAILDLLRYSVDGSNSTTRKDR